MADQDDATIQINKVLARHTAAFSQLEKETDRAVAVICGSFLEETLKGALQSRLKADQAIFDKLFEPEGSLGEFATKNRLAYLMGLYTKTIHDDLSLTARIRNDFAHNIDHDSFENDFIKSKCASLRLVQSNIVAYNDDGSRPSPKNCYATHYYQRTERDFILKNPRHRFIKSFMLLLNHLVNIQLNPRRPEFPVDLDAPPPGFASA